jgi:hypothetical protein
VCAVRPIGDIDDDGTMYESRSSGNEASDVDIASGMCATSVGDAEVTCFICDSRSGGDDKRSSKGSVVCALALCATRTGGDSADDVGKKY